MFLYLLPAALTLALALEALRHDQETSLQERHAWVFIILITVLWPITLPSIIWHQSQKHWVRPLDGAQ